MKLLFLTILSVFLVTCSLSMTNKIQDSDLDLKHFGSDLDEVLSSAVAAHKIFDTINSALLTPSPRLCWGCSLLFTTLLRYVGLHGQNIDEFIMKNLCPKLPHAYQPVCNTLIGNYGAIIINALAEHQSPDAVCRAIKVCNMPQCNLVPKGEEPTVSFSPNWQQYLQAEPAQPIALSESVLDEIYTRIILDVISSHPESPLVKWIETLEQAGESPLDWIKALIAKVFTNHKPAVDFDGDGFSEMSGEMRGFNWKGRDCNDDNAEIYPGRKTDPYPSLNVDYNCNGISGVDPKTAQGYKDLYCANSGQMGVVVMGDSAGAHAEIPSQWVNASAWDSYKWADLIDRVANEVDLPHMSAYTGYAETGYTGPVSSIYKYMYQRNKCNFRDYLNIAVNGLDILTAQSTLSNLARNQQNDYPVLAFLELVGNDVCGSETNLDSMTTPEQFRTNLIQILDTLDTILPAGSHLVTLGLANGSLIFDGVNGRMHPVGVTYNQLYDFQNCLGASFCYGWLNTNETIRAETTQRAVELSQVYGEVLSTYTAKNFDFTYYDFPTQEIWDEWTGAGNDPYLLIEPVDGFHPNQMFNSLLGDYLWNALSRDHPDWLGSENPYNNQIDQMFGAQGGY